MQGPKLPRSASGRARPMHPPLLKDYRTRSSPQRKKQAIKSRNCLIKSLVFNRRKRRTNTISMACAIRSLRCKGRSTRSAHRRRHRRPTTLRTPRNPHPRAPRCKARSRSLQCIRQQRRTALGERDAREKRDRDVAADAGGRCDVLQRASVCRRAVSRNALLQQHGGPDDYAEPRHGPSRSSERVDVVIRAFAVDRASRRQARVRRRSHEAHPSPLRIIRTMISNRFSERSSSCSLHPCSSKPPS